jgi:glyoxylase-like metal-dependent hydrolase (beta-lactamase superfamily II)
MIVRQLAVGPMQNFVYLLVDEASRDALVVDSGWETEPILKAVAEEKAHVLYVVATHNHFDHVASLQDLAQALGAKVVAHVDSPIQHDMSVKDGDTLKLGDKEVKVIATPGHSEDGICLYDGENLFTGDTLFIGGCGRTDLVGSSNEELFHSLHDVILKLPPSTRIYPGHDYGDAPSRDLGTESKRNLALFVRNLDDFAALS